MEASPRRAVLRTGLGALLVLSMVVAGCGTGSNDQASPSNQSEESAALCEGMVDFAQTLDGGSRDADALAETAAQAQDLRLLVPADAPADLDTLLTAGATVLELASQQAADPSLEVPAEELAEALGVLTGVDSGRLESWLDDYCSDLDGFDSGAVLGLGGQQAGSTSSATTPPSTTTTTIPLQQATLAGPADPAVYLGATLQVEAVDATNQSPIATALGTPVAVDESFVVITVATKTTDYPFSIRARDITLTEPGGNGLTPGAFADLDGREQVGIELRAGEATTTRWIFAVAEPVDDFSNWSLRIGADGTIPATLSVGEPVTNPYPVNLEPGPTVRLSVDSVVASCEAAPVDVTVTRSVVGLEADDGRGLRRADDGTRLLEIEVDATNQQQDASVTCRSTIAMFDYGFRLDVDGRSMTSDHALEGFAFLEPGNSESIRLLYVIPDDAASVTLVGVNDEPIDSWSISLPEP